MDKENFSEKDAFSMVQYVQGVASQFVASAEDVIFINEESVHVHSASLRRTGFYRESSSTASRILDKIQGEGIICLPSTLSLLPYILRTIPNMRVLVR